MAWVRFVATHWQRLSPQVKRRYDAGREMNVPKRVADEAVRLGRAVRMKKRRGAAPEVADGEEAQRR